MCTKGSEEKRWNRKKKKINGGKDIRDLLLDSRMRNVKKSHDWSMEIERERQSESAKARGVSMIVFNERSKMIENKNWLHLRSWLWPFLSPTLNRKKNISLVLQIEGFVSRLSAILHVKILLQNGRSWLKTTIFWAKRKKRLKNNARVFASGVKFVVTA